jgi:hypothetical protein
MYQEEANNVDEGTEARDVIPRRDAEVLRL